MPLRKRTHGEGYLIAGLLLAALVSLAPFIGMVSSSFKPNNEIFQSGLQLLSSNPTVDNYRNVFAKAPMLQFLLNGLIVCLGVLIGQLLVIIPAGSRLEKTLS